MFHSARIQLTLWYLLIIMLVSISFSVVIYEALGNEVERFARVQRFRIERVSPDLILRTPAPSVPDVELIEETKRRLRWVLIIINTGIFVVAGGLGYLLADRTLQPIQEMVNEQYRFISDASHELKTPLTSLKSAFEVYLRDKTRTQKDADEIVQESIVEVNKLQTLSENLLQLTKYQESNLTTHFEKLSLEKVIASSIQKITPIAKRKKITITFKSMPLEINGSINQLRELFVILLDNAVKYSPEASSIIIEMSKTKKIAKVTVEDHGMGIDKKDLPHIFDRFYRADQARSKNNTDGYGLGLSIAQKSVELHKGTIAVSSQKNVGSSFIIRLPLV